MALLLLSVGIAGASDVRVVQAVRDGDAAAVRSLLERKADVNAPEVDGTTALHWAVRADDAETVARLIRAGAKANAANRYGVTPLSIAVGIGNPVDRRGAGEGRRRRALHRTGRRDRADDRVTHGTRGSGPRAAGPRRGRQREGALVRADRPDVGRRRKSSGGGSGADRRRRGAERTCRPARAAEARYRRLSGPTRMAWRSRRC